MVRGNRFMLNGPPGRRNGPPPHSSDAKSLSYSIIRASDCFLLFYRGNRDLSARLPIYGVQRRLQGHMPIRAERNRPLRPGAVQPLQPPVQGAQGFEGRATFRAARQMQIRVPERKAAQMA